MVAKYGDAQATIKVLRTIDDGAWYVRNSDLHRDLRIPLKK